MPSKANIELAKTCKRYYESSLWTSTILFVWLRWQRRVRAWVTVIPLFLGSTPGVVTVVKLLSQQNFVPIDVVTSVLSFIAGMTPLIYKVLELDERLQNCERLSAEYTNLRDRFRTAAEVSINKATKEFEEDINPLIERVERAREVGLITPDWAYKKAAEKIKAGHYDFEVDLSPADNLMVAQIDTTSTTSTPAIAADSEPTAQ